MPKVSNKYTNNFIRKNAFKIYFGLLVTRFRQECLKGRLNQVSFVNHNDFYFYFFLETRLFVHISNSLDSIVILLQIFFANKKKYNSNYESFTQKSSTLNLVNFLTWNMPHRMMKNGLSLQALDEISRVFLIQILIKMLASKQTIQRMFAQGGDEK